MHPKVMSEIDKYRRRGRPSVGGTKAGGESKHSLIFSKACWQSLFQTVGWFFLRRQKIGSYMFVSLAMKLLMYGLDLFLSPRSGHVKYGLNLFWINLYIALANIVTQQFLRSYPKGALIGIQSHSELSDHLKEPL